MSLPVNILGADTTTGALVVNDALNVGVQEGIVFGAGDVITVTASTTRYILFNPDAVTNAVFAPTPLFTATNGPIIVTWYINSDYSGGTAVITYNNLVGGPNPGTVITIDPTGTDVGDKVGSVLIPATSTGINNTGFGTTEETPFAFPPSVQFLIGVENTNGADAKVGYRFTWVEV